MFSRSRLTEARLHHAAYYLQRLRQWESAQQQSQHTEDDFAQDILQIQQAQSWCVDAGAMLPQAARLCSDFGLIESNTLESLFSAERSWHGIKPLYNPPNSSTTNKRRSNIATRWRFRMGA